MDKQRNPTSNGKSPAKDSRKNAPSQINSQPFPIAGIGASVVGLEALEQFLSHVPEKSGIALAVVQHSDRYTSGSCPPNCVSAPPA